MPRLDDANLQLHKPTENATQDQAPGVVDVFATPTYNLSAAEYNDLIRRRQIPLFDWANMVWETEVEPPVFFDEDDQVTQSPLLHLYTVTGFLCIGHWPEGEPIGRHFVSWAYADPDFDSYTPTTHH
jgi:hypothetical protein